MKRDTNKKEALGSTSSAKPTQNDAHRENLRIFVHRLLVAAHVLAITLPGVATGSEVEHASMSAGEGRHVRAELKVNVGL